jgi:hypothetical protein
MIPLFVGCALILGLVAFFAFLYKLNLVKDD